MYCMSASDTPPLTETTPCWMAPVCSVRATWRSAPSDVNTSAEAVSIGVGRSSTPRQLPSGCASTTMRDL